MAKNTISTHGSILLTTLFFITLFTVLAWGVYDLANTAYRLSQHNEYRARAKALADSELDFIFFRIKTAMIRGIPANGVPDALSDICDIPRPDPTIPNQTCTPTTVDRSPFCAPFRGTLENWTVGRSISYDFSAFGVKDHKTSSYSYFTVKVQVMANNSPVGPIVVRVGRRMNSSLSSIFQYNIFAQGDLEFAPGGSVTINGDIAANGNIYIGAALTDNVALDGTHTPSTLTLGAYVRYLQGQTFETTHLADITKLIKPPIFNTTGGQAAQVSTMDKPENLLGGLLPKDIASKFGVDQTYLPDSTPVPNTDYNALFGTITVDRTNTPDPLLLAAAVNRVYRSVITPPPEAVAAAAALGADFHAEYPDVASASALASISDDPSVQALRAYTRAGLILTVNADGTTTFTARNSEGIPRDVTTDFSSVSGLLTATSMYDLREAKDVGIVEIDVAKLKVQLALSAYADFNGLFYVYLGSSSSSHPAAVRLVNGAATPVSALDHGFSLATNGGLYVKGDYNTVTLGNDADGIPIHNPTMLMADAVTVLSSAWNDTVVTAQTGDSVSVIASKHNPTDTIGSRVATSGGTTIAAGILTGTITEDSSGNYLYSGGGQNLVRFLENWEASNVDFFGSIGRLFQSTQFTRSFKSPNDAGYPNIYRVPSHRTFTFNTSLKKKSPYGAIGPTEYSRGTVFNW